MTDEDVKVIPMSDEQARAGGPFVLNESDLYWEIVGANGKVWEVIEQTSENENRSEAQARVAELNRIYGRCAS